MGNNCLNIDEKEENSVRNENEKLGFDEIADEKIEPLASMDKTHLFRRRSKICIYFGLN